MGLCKNLHGHNYVLEVEVVGSISLHENAGNGMVIDYSLLDEIIKREVISPLDHTNLNDIIPNPTAEHILTVIIGWLSRHVIFGSGPIRLHSIKLWETERSWAYWEAKH